jgi:hypothetical protein
LETEPVPPSEASSHCPNVSKIDQADADADGVGDACDGSIIFVTSERWPRSYLGGLSGADAKCQAAAESAGLPGTYKAWLSSLGVDARDRLVHALGPYVRTDGEVLAFGWSDLVDGHLLTEPSRDEIGLSHHWEVWMGTFDNGWRAVDTCDRWTRVSMDSAVGRSFGDSGWSYSQPQNCENLASLYCIQQTQE